MKEARVNANNKLIREIIQESSYLFYEFRDVKEEVSQKNISYSKYISPLFCKDVINAPFNKTLLSIIFEETPFYHLEPSGEFKIDNLDENAIIYSTRDIGINNVASSLQSPFWEVLFRESFGAVDNELLLNIFNKLRYPIIGEYQYLNAGLFPELSKKYFDENDSSTGKKISFRNKEEDNLIDELKFKKEDKERETLEKLKNPKNYKRKRNKEVLGCIRYLNDIVNQKLNSINALLNYNQKSTSSSDALQLGRDDWTIFGVVESWASSQKNSGKLTAQDYEREKTIYKLQDLKYELLRRKFAGSTALYKIALASLNRRGSLARTIALGDTFIDDSEKEFSDSRPIRILRIPGGLSDPFYLTEMSPYETFYTNAKLKNEEIPLGLLVPLYYTSTPQLGYSLEKYKADKFYTEKVNRETERYRIPFLRSNSNVINWNTPESPTSLDSFVKTSLILDESITNPDSKPGSEDSRIYRELDSPFYLELNKKDIITAPITKLDTQITAAASKNITGVVLDVSLDTILYHENIIQKERKTNYPFVTYPFSNNTSLSLIDTNWLNAIKGMTEEKSRVQDEISLGSQISRVTPITPFNVPHMFFAISYGDDTIFDSSKQKTLQNLRNPNNWVSTKNSNLLNKETYSFSEWVKIKNKYPKFAYLWLYTFKYSSDTFEAVGQSEFEGSSKFKSAFPYFEVTLISKIVLRLCDLERLCKLSDESAKDFHKMCPYSKEDFNKYKSEMNAGNQENRKEKVINIYNTNLGVIPFTYKEMVNDSVLSLILGPDPKEPGKYYDDIADSNYNKALFLFSDKDLLAIPPYSEVFDKNSQFMTIPAGCTSWPTENTKMVFYGKRELNQTLQYTDEHTNLYYDYTWSSGIPVLPLHQFDSKILKEIELGINLENKNSLFSKPFFYHPDWDGLQFYLNPYLNKNAESASPLRHKKIAVEENKLISSDISGKTYLGYVDFSKEIIKDFNTLGKSAILCNINRWRHKGFTCNDLGEIEEIKDSKKTLKSIFGIYIHHEHPEAIITDNEGFLRKNPDPEYLDIFGDNRILDYYDEYKGKENSKNTSLEYLDSKRGNYKNSISNIDCLHFTSVYKKYYEGFNSANSPAFNNPCSFKLNYLELLPARKELIQNSTKDIQDKIWDTWIWNGKKSGITVGCKIELFYEDLKNALEEPLPEITSENNISIILHRTSQRWNIINRENEFWLDIENIKIINEEVSFNFKFGINIGSLENLKYKEVTSETFYIKENQNSQSYNIGASFLKNENIIGYKQLYLMINGKSYLGDQFNYSSKVEGSLTLSNKIPKGILIGTRLKTGKAFDPVDKVEKNITIQTDIFRGDIYDIRLYDRGSSLENLYLISRGSVAELYSYSPSIYKLGYSLYRDLGLFKVCKSDLTREDFTKINKIRIFSRSVWDSIYVDPFPISKNESTLGKNEYIPDYRDPLDDSDIYIKKEDTFKLNNVVQQNLIDKLEVSNPKVSDALEISYNNNRYLTVTSNPEDKKIPNDFTVVNTLIQPTDYNSVPFKSKAILTLTKESDKFIINTAKNNPIKLPIKAEPGTLGYFADLGLNFEVSEKGNFATSFSFGENIVLKYNEALKQIVISPKKSVRVNERNPQNNYLVTPFIIPEQPKLRNQAFSGRVQEILISNLQFTKAINTLLQSYNYYTEISIPYYLNSTLVGNKYDAIRTLREGVYYLTYKYPIQILPLSDLNMLYTESSMNTYYGTARFKIEVTGEPSKLQDLPDELRNGSVTVSKNRVSCKFYKPEDNRNYGNRIINIKLFVMTLDYMDDTSEKTTFKWELLGSNNPTDAAPITLDRTTVENNIVFSDKKSNFKYIPLFLSADYSTGIFNFDKDGNGEYPSTIPNLKSGPIVKIGESLYNTDKLYVNKEEDLKDQRMRTGCSYRLLLDYEANCTEFSYIPTDDAILGKEDNKINAEEVLSYRKAINLLVSSSEEKVCYFIPNNTLKAEESTASAGFNIIKENQKYIYSPIGSSGSKTFGNPYSVKKSENFLIKNYLEKNGSIKELGETLESRIFTFPYLTEGIPGSYLSKFTTSNNKTLTWSEEKELKNIFSIRKYEVLDALNSLKTNSAGIFDQLSTFKVDIKYNYLPNITPNPAATETFILTHKHDLCGYYIRDTSLQHNQDIKITKASILSDNLISISNLLKENASWKIEQNGSTLVSNDIQDLFNKNGTYFSFKLTAGKENNGIKLTLTDQILKIDEYDYLSSTIILASNLDDISITAVFRDENGGEIYRISYNEDDNFEELLDVTGSMYFYKYKPETDIFKLGKQATISSIDININFDATVDSEVILNIKDIIFQKTTFITQPLGLSDLSAKSNSLLLPAVHIVAFKRKNSMDPSLLVPLTFNGKVINTAGIGTTVSNADMVSFINEMAIDGNEVSLFKPNPNRFIKLYQPWIGRLSVYQRIERNQMGKEEIKFKAEIHQYIKDISKPTGVTVGEGNLCKIYPNAPTVTLTHSEESTSADELTLSSFEIKINKIDDNTEENSTYYDSNLKLISASNPDYSAVVLTNEKVSGLSNCFDPQSFLRAKKGEVINSAVTAVTNIQLIYEDSINNDSQKVSGPLCEFEYLPIIYDELQNHLSANFLFLHQEIN